MKTSIAKKISAAIAAFIFIIMILSWMFIANYTKNLTLADALEKKQLIQDAGASQLQIIVQDLNSFCESLAFESDIQEYCLNPENANDFNTIKNISDLMRGYANRRTFVHSISLISPQHSIWSAYPFEDTLDESLKMDWYKDLSKDSRQIQFSAPHFLNISERKNIRLITVKSNIYHSKNPTLKIGEILIHLNADEWQKQFSEFYNGFTEFMLVDENNNVLIHTSKDNSYVLSEYFDNINSLSNISEEPIKYSDGYIIRSHLNKGILSVVTFSKENTLSTNMNYLIIFMLILTPITMLVITLLCIILINSYMAPLSQLSDKMKAFANGELNVKVNIKTGDELELLGNTFNTMVDDINQLIADNNEKEKQKKKLQIDMLMSRIHPHFLYNTLNSSVYLAHNEKAYDCENMLRSLIIMLQSGMKMYDDKLTDTLDNELKIIDAYCTIQKYRYKDKFTFTCDASNKEIIIPKNILQPLIENAIYHGIVPSDDPGTIELSVYESEDSVELYLSDSGVGMSQEIIDNLNNKQIQSEDSTHSIGIQTIKDRLNYLYNGNYTMQVYSEEFKGTTWYIRFPKKGKL
ncbi:MAG: histidine kinase [Eubacteriales bacterium]|nr:histidine kinase [Eubacteriales bacterium]